jgi:hypothetical protein
MKLPGCDLVALKASCCGEERAHVLHERADRCRRYFQLLSGHGPDIGSDNRNCEISSGVVPTRNERENREGGRDDKIESEAILFGAHLFYAESNKDNKANNAQDVSHFPFPKMNGACRPL